MTNLSRSPGPKYGLEQHVPWHAKAGFAAGHVPDDIKNFAWDLFVLFLYTQVYGLSGTLTGLAILIALVFDAISDTYVGFLSDNVRQLKFGRRHTLMIIACIPFSLCFFALFVPPPGLGQMGLFLWLTVFAVLTRLFITTFVVPLKAVGAELSRNFAQRPQIVAWGAVGGTAARVALPLVAFGYFFKASEEYSRGQLDPANYPPFALAFAIASLVGMVVCILLTIKPVLALERLEKHTVRHRLGLVDTVKAVVSAMTVTPNVRRAVLLALLVFFAIKSITVLKVHIVTYLWQTPADLTQWIVAAQYIGLAVGAIALPVAVKQFDRKLCVSVGMVGFTTFTGLAVLLPVLGLMPPAGSRELAYGVIAMLFCAGVLLGVYFVAIGSLGADVADEHEANTGKRQQALISGFGMLAIKSSSAVMTMITGLYLDLIKFPVGMAVADVPLEKVHALAIFGAAFCLIGGLSVLYVVSRFDISLEKQRDINRRLAAMLKVDDQDVPAQAADPTVEPGFGPQYADDKV